MEIRISISIDDTLRRVYALSALRTYMNSKERDVPMLTPDNRLALAGLVRDAFSQLALSLMPNVVACSIPEDDTEDLLSLDLSLAEGAATASTLRHAIENVLADSAMGAAMSDVDSSLSHQFYESAERGLDGVRSCFSDTFTPVAIRGYR